MFSLLSVRIRSEFHHCPGAAVEVVKLFPLQVLNTRESSNLLLSKYPPHLAAPSFLPLLKRGASVVAMLELVASTNIFVAF